ncbi:MAG: DUF5103 domain-containing protein [Bacteroidales bacterium]|nr:DUF5103 domain-containing protein [Bacteroidales bacterium]
MKIASVLITYLMLIQVSFVPAAGQELYSDDQGQVREMVLDHSIKTVQLYREGWPMSYPVVRLSEDVPLILEFDDLSEEQPAFMYRMIHCNADWTPSDLSEQEYLEGYPENEIRTSVPSFNTYTSYLHYRLRIPNEDTRLLLSGNYLLLVYRDRNPDDVVFTRRFMMTEGRVNIEANAHIPDLNPYKGCCQEVDFTVNHAGITIDDPFSETRAVVYQNGLWDLGIDILQPYMIRPGQLVYDYQKENIFQGGNEFRFFDTKNTRTPTYFVQEINFVDPFFHFELKPDQPRSPHNYFFQEDINGRYAIEAEGSQDPGVDSDYVVVHFRLEMPLPLEGSVYMTGALTNWQFDELSRMEYNDQEQAYMLNLLLKQGVYNYRYLFLPAFSEQFDMAEIEGSHFETGNEYLILFYHRPPGSRYDRLLGHQVIHTNQ